MRRAGRARSRLAISSAARCATRSSSARTSGAGTGCTGRTVPGADGVCGSLRTADEGLTPLAVDRARPTLEACPAALDEAAAGRTRRHQALRCRRGAHRRRLRRRRRRGRRARRRQRRRQVDPDQGDRRRPARRRRRVLDRRSQGQHPHPAGRHAGSASRPSTRTSRCATTSTSSPTSISAPSSSSPAWGSSGARSTRPRWSSARASCSRSLSVTTLESPRAPGRLAVRRPAPGGRDRARARRQPRAADPRRADRGARRRADRAGPRADPRTCASSGLAIVVISHNLDTVFDVADRIAVLRLGRHVATFDRRATTREDVVAAITGALPGRAVAA